MAISRDLESSHFKNFSARRQPWWHLVEGGPRKRINVPTPLIVRQSNQKNTRSDNATHNSYIITQRKQDMWNMKPVIVERMQTM